MPRTRKNEEPPPAASEFRRMAERLALAERGAWLGPALAHSVHPPVRVILDNLARAGAALESVGVFARQDGRTPQGGPPSPDLALCKVRASFEEAAAAAIYLSRIAQDLCVLAAAPRRIAVEHLRAGGSGDR